MKVRDYLEFVARIHEVPKKRLKQQIDWVIEKCGLKDQEKRLLAHLSKGYRQRAGIAQALVHSPKVIVLDEPTNGLDPSAISEIRDLILSLRKEHTILLSTHLLHEAELICSDITIINQGTIVNSGRIEDIKKNFQVKQVFIAELSNFDDQKEKMLQTRLNCHIDREDDRYVRFYFDTKEDVRSSLSSELISLNCSLLSFRQVEIELEDIFKTVINKGDK